MREKTVKSLPRRCLKVCIEVVHGSFKLLPTAAVVGQVDAYWLRYPLIMVMLLALFLSEGSQPTTGVQLLCDGICLGWIAAP